MLKIFFILAFFYFVVPKLIKWAFKGFIVSQVNKAQQRGTQEKQYSNRNEGDIKVNYVPKKDKFDTFKGGEYVDYEEVK